MLRTGYAGIAMRTRAHYRDHAGYTIIQEESIMTRHPSLFAAAALICTLSLGCGQDPLSSSPFSDFNTAAEAVATLQGNTIDAELLALSEDIEEVSSPSDETVPPPNQHPAPRLDRLQEALGLTDEQVSQIEAIITATRDQLTAIHEQVRDGALTREQAHEQIRTIRENERAQIEAVLTEEQRAKFEELRRQHGRQFNAQRLADFLGLTDEQAAQVDSIMQSHWEQVHALREQVEAGTLTREQAREQIQALHEAERDQLASILTEEQVNRFNRILRHHRFGFGPRGFGRGPQGNFPPPGEG
jgi:hypothetical protein